MAMAMTRPDQPAAILAGHPRTRGPALSRRRHAPPVVAIGLMDQETQWRSHQQHSSAGNRREWCLWCGERTRHPDGVVSNPRGFGIGYLCRSCNDRRWVARQQGTA